MALTEAQKVRHAAANKRWQAEHPGYFVEWRMAHPEHVAEHSARKVAWRARNPGHETVWRTTRLESRAGRRKPKRCDVCRKTAYEIHFDHDHRTNLFRGRVCHHCNAVLGYGKDSSKLLRAIAVYLERPMTAIFVGHRQVTMRRAEKLLGRRPEKCGMCKRAGKVCMDHDHKTGFFRGWLCITCNLACGHAFDSPKLIRKLADYLDTHKCSTKKKAA